MTGFTLAISASSRLLSVALRRADGSVVSPLADDAGQRGAEVASAVDALLQRAGENKSSLARILVDVGPGSYTGLRVAVTFARFLASFGDAELAVVSSLELMALAARLRGDAPTDAPLRPILDARRQRFHTARIEAGDSIVLGGEPAALKLAPLREAMRPDEVLLTDPAVVEMIRAAFGQTEPRILAPVPYDATDLLHPSLSPRQLSPDEIEPLYLMGSYAEED